MNHYSPGEQQVLDALWGIRKALGLIWYPTIVRNDVFSVVLPAAERYLQEHPLDHQVRIWIGDVETGVDRYLFSGGVASRFRGLLNNGRVITVSRKEYQVFTETTKEGTNERPCMSIPDQSEQAEFMSILPGEVNPSAETVPLFMVQEDHTPGNLARWGMTLRWVD